MQSMNWSPRILLIVIAGLGGACLDVSTANYECARIGGVVECWRSPICGNRQIERGEECDDGNHEPGDGCSAECRDTAPPRVEVLFPPARSSTFEREITIRGTVDDASGVESVLVNNVPAELDAPNWQVVLPLDLGENELVVKSRDESGNVDLAAAKVVVVSKSLSVSIATAFLEEEQQFLILDAERGALVSIDLETDEHRIISDTDTGSGLLIGSPRAMVLDAARGRVLFTDDMHDALVGIDLDTGNRYIVSGDTRGTGPLLDAPFGLTLDPYEDRVLLVDYGLNVLVSIELASGDRRIVSGQEKGSGDAFALPMDVALDRERKRALIVDPQIDGLWGVDLESGERTILTGPEKGCNIPLYEAYTVTFDPERGEAMILDWEIEGLVAINLETCERVWGSDRTRGDGPPLLRPARMSLDRKHERALVIDIALGALVSVQVPHGTRTIMSRTGAGDRFEAPQRVVAGPAEHEALVLDAEGLVVVDLETGDRRSGLELPPQIRPADLELSDIALNSSKTRALVLDFGIGLVSVDLATKEPKIVSSSLPGLQKGSGPSLQTSKSLALDEANDRALVVDIKAGALVAIDLATGERRIVSDADKGSGVALLAPTSVILDEERERVLVTNYGDSSLVAIDLATGDRQVVSDAQHGSGPLLVGPVALALEPDGQGVVVADEVNRTLLHIDLETGNRQVASESGYSLMGSGRPRGLHELGHGELALVADVELKALLLVDLVTGERVIVSQ